MTKCFGIIDLLQENILCAKRHNWKIQNVHLFFSLWIKLHLPKMSLIYMSCSKYCTSATIHIWTRDWNSRCTLYNMAGYMLAQISVIRFRSSSIVGGGVSYTLCLMYTHRKKSNVFRSGERGDHFTQPPYPMICYWNVSRRYCWPLDTLREGTSSCWNHKFRRSFNGKSSTKSDIASCRGSKYRDPANFPS